MDISKLPLFETMQSKLKAGSARQAVLAQNVANADTPGYKARDIEAQNFSSMLAQKSSLRMATTNGKHMLGGGASISGGSRTIERKSTYELNPIGNNVVIEEEMMKVAENQAEYQKTLSVYRKSIELFKIALGKGSGA